MYRCVTCRSAQRHPARAEHLGVIPQPRERLSGPGVPRAEARHDAV